MWAITGTAALVVLMALLPARPACAQGLQVPSSWRWLTDEPARTSAVPDKIQDSVFTLVGMAPGWHITMGTNRLAPTRD
jgi:hypothetical protein